MTVLHDILSATITDEAALCWWRISYTGATEPMIRHGRPNKADTPLYDTNWMPADAARCLIYREMGDSTAAIARLVGKSHHAVSDLFARVDQWPTRQQEAG